jgi:hypothetical protein
LVPDTDEVWRRVATYARDCLKKNRPVFTVTRRVKNRITDVRDGSIGRRLTQGTSNSSRVTRKMVGGNLLSKIQGGNAGSGYLSTLRTKALVLAALPGLVEDMDDNLVLQNDPRLRT